MAVLGVISVCALAAVALGSNLAQPATQLPRPVLLGRPGPRQSFSIKKETIPPTGPAARGVERR
ncbi:MAG: hypothetical protein ACRDZY_11135, partial [Acidimicrobiales bacterium]